MSDRRFDERSNDAERLARIETVVRKIDNDLFGNGQPGAIAIMNSRITKLENWRWYIVGIAVGLGVVVGGYADRLIKAVVGR